jgi:tripartite-type tricarboxylate transporter receptor subunit TctC
VLDTVADRTQVLFSAATQTLPYVKSGKLKLLAVTEDKRSTLFPKVPTVGETIPGYELAVWYGFFGPRGMNPALVQRLNRVTNEVLAQPDVIQAMNHIGVVLVHTTPEQFSDILKRDANKYGKLIKELGVTIE